MRPSNTRPTLISTSYDRRVGIYQLDPAAGNPGLWGPTWLVDDNPDHTNVGLAIKQLGDVAGEHDVIA